MKKSLYALIAHLFTMNVLYSQGVNLDFESSAPGVYNTASGVSGWTLSSQVVTSCTISPVWNPGSSEFSILNTPLISYLTLGPNWGVVPNSPLGGSRIAALNNSISNFLSTKIAQTFTVTNALRYLSFAYAFVLQDATVTHSCCEGSNFKINIYDCLGNLSTCYSKGIEGASNCFPSLSYSYAPAPVLFGSNWQLKTLDLSQYIGSCVTLEVIASDCIFGGHYGFGLFDAVLAPFAMGCLNCLPANPLNVNLCASSNTAVIVAPPGNLSYSWTAPANYPPLSTSQSTLSTLSILNPTIGSIFTVNITPSVGCQYSLLYTVNYSASSVSIGSVGSASSCPQGANGSATVNAAGSSMGYNYNWVNSSNVTVSSSSVASNLSPGTYSVSVASPIGCGTAVSTVTINAGTTSYNLLSSQPNCEGSANGEVTFTLTPASTNQKTLSISPTGTTSGLSNTFTSTASTYTFSGLGGGTYSTVIYDGLCSYSLGFSLNTFPTTNSFSFSVVNPTLCPGQNLTMGVVLTSTISPSQYTYSWSPPAFLSATTTQSVIISPSLPTASITTTIYSVTLNPFVVNCPVTNTVAITVANPQPPVINPIPSFCQDPLTSFTITGIPVGGVYTGTGILPGGILVPSLSAVGQNNFIYSISIGTCAASTAGTYTIIPGPVISISGTTVICEGQSTTLLAGGANSYTWNNTSIGPVFSVSPLPLNSYTVAGTSTLTNCSSTKVVSINVMPMPTVSISGNRLVCKGEQITLTGSGASSYSWSTGSSGQQITVSPVTNTTYVLQGSNASVSCSDSKTITVKISNCTGIIEETGSLSINLFPNPARDKFFVETSTTINLTLTDESGRIILQESFEKGTFLLNLHSYAGGVYILKASDGIHLKIFKLVKTTD